MNTLQSQKVFDSYSVLRTPVFAEGPVANPESYWNNVLWTDETKADFLALRSSLRTCSHLQNIVVALDQ